MAGLPEVVIHGDFHGGNLLVADNEVCAVVDWDFAVVDWRVLDIAAGVRSFIEPGARDAVENAMAFVREYESITGPLAPSELHCLPDALRLRLWATVLYDEGRAARGQLDSEGLRYRAEDVVRTEAFADDLAAVIA